MINYKIQKQFLKEMCWDSTRISAKAVSSVKYEDIISLVFLNMIMVRENLNSYA